LNNLDVDLNENILAQLELEDALSQDFGQLSLNALAGTSQGQAMRVRALVKNKVMLLLVDSGSSHSFISSTFCTKLVFLLFLVQPRLSKWQMVLLCSQITLFQHWNGGQMATLSLLP
jgi:hypothetical protein